MALSSTATTQLRLWWLFALVPTGLSTTPGCGDDTGASLRLVPVPSIGVCGQAVDRRSLFVTYFGDRGQQRFSVEGDGEMRLAEVPEDLRQLGVEVLGPGGATVAIGKSAELSAGALLTTGQREISIAMIPPGGMCPTGRLSEARAGALIAPVGDGALVVGGDTASGPSMTVDRYDRASGGFTAVEVPTALVNDNGWRGAAITVLSPTRVVLTGGPRPAYVVFDAERGFAAPGLLESRASHAAVALSSHQVLIAGGCAIAEASGCAPGSGLRSTRILDVDTGELQIGPNLAAARVGGSAWLEPSRRDGGGALVVAIAGGVDDAGLPSETIERIDLQSGTVEVFAAHAGTAIALDSGATLLADLALGTTQVVVPNSDGVVAGSQLARPDGNVLALEDGTVIALGGAAASTATVYVPMRDRWRSDSLLGEPPIGGLLRSAAVQLRDGSVLLVGGQRTDLSLSDGAFVYRPSLLGPWSGQATVTPTSAEEPPQLVPLDPTQVERADGWTLLAPDDGRGNWAVIAGPRADLASLRATVTVLAGGLALIVRASRGVAGDIVTLVPGQLARVTSIVDGEEVELCRGITVPSLPSALTVALHATLRDDLLTVSIDGTEVVACTLQQRPPGLWGLAAVGPAGQLNIATVSLERTP